MPGTKRLAVTGPWHGQMIEPDSDAYTVINAKVEPVKVTGLILPGMPQPEPVSAEVVEVPYCPVAYPIPLVRGVAAMPLLVPAGLTPTAPEVLDALVLAAFGEVAS
jgi:hypothetical protein